MFIKQKSLQQQKENSSLRTVHLDIAHTIKTCSRTDEISFLLQTESTVENFETF